MNKQTTKLASLSLSVMVLLSVFAGVSAFAGAAAAANTSDYEFDEELEDSKTYWTGQTLFSDESSNSAADTTYEVHGSDDSDADNSNYFQQVRVDSDGGLLINTSNMEPGEYYVEDSSDTRQYDFTIAKQTFSVDSSDDDSSDSVQTFEFNSNRVGFDVIVEADNLDASDLERIIGADSETIADVDDDSDDKYVIEDVSDGDEIDATFEEDDEGEYNISFEVRDTGETSMLENFSVNEPNDATGDFSQSLYNGAEGDIVSFNVSMENTDRVNVHLGDDDMNYHNNFTVVDGDDDDVVEVKFDSFKAGDGGSTQTVTTEDSDDSIENIDTESSINDMPLDSGTYDLSLRTNGEEQDVSAIVLNDRSTTGATSNVVPKGDKTSDVEDIQSNAVESQTVALEDKLVLAFETTGVYSQLEDATAGDLTEDNSKYGFNVVVEDNSESINAEPETLDVSDATLQTDADNGTFYLVFDTNDYSELEEDDEYRAHLNMTEENPYIDDEDEADSQDANTTFTVAEREVTFDDMDEDDDTVYVRGEENYELSGTTTVAPGSEITVVARSEGSAAFLYNEEVVVSENRTFSAVYDFSGLSEGEEFTVGVQSFDEEDAVAGSTPSEDYPVSVTTVDQNGADVDANISVDGEAADGDIALSNGTYTVSASAENYSDASQEVTIDGEGASVTLTLMPPKNDLSVVTVDENGEPVDASVTVDGEALSGDTIALMDGDYTVSASADGYSDASQEVTIDGAAKSTTLTLTAEETTDTATPTPTEDDSDSDNSDNATDEDPAATTTEDPGQPGFGVVVALLALVGAGLLATRRQE